MWRSVADDVLESEEPTASGDWHLISHFLAMPEDSLDGVLMYGGRLLFRLDELTFIETFQLFFPSTSPPALIGLCLGDLFTWVI
jgi:hypothetical protein